MSDPIIFKPIHPGLRDILPYNYLPAAMADIAGTSLARGRRLFPLRDPSDDESRQQGAKSFVIDSETLKNPLAVALKLQAVRSENKDGGPVERWFLGPPTDRFDECDLPFTPHVKNVVAGARKVAAIVDAGIAFWDPAFRSGDSSRFREIAYLDFDAVGGNNAPSERLDREQIKALCNTADTEGPEAVVRELGLRFPNSAFGKNGGAYPDQGWHGTGVADLMVGSIAESEDDVAVFGFELPAAVLRDHDGDSLLAVLTLIVEMILASTSTDALETLPLVIVLPFGFVSGPQDGSHPAVKALEQLLAQQTKRQVDLVVPAGNHLQDRCVARFEAPSPAVPQPTRSVIWRVPPDDFSPNGIELVRAGVGGTVDLRITPPGEAPIDISLQEGDFGLLMRGNRTIGALIRRADTATSAAVRFAVIGTGWDRADAHPAPVGDWQIAEVGESAVDLYALRDDRDVAGDKGRPRWPASFADVGYRDTDAFGVPLLQDDAASVVRRTGTASLLTTVPGTMAVQADERLGGNPRTQAWYSGNRADHMPWEWSALVDDGWPSRGYDCAANGTAQRARLSGTSAAAGLHARCLLGLSPRLPG